MVMGETFKERRRREIRERIIQAIRDLGAEKPKGPRLRELAKSLGYAHYSTLGYHLGHSGKNGISYSMVFDDAYREAGFERRRPGPDLGCRKIRGSGTMGSRLTQKRLELGLTQAESSDLVDLAKNTIGSHEMDKSRPRKGNREKYARSYNVSDEWILTGNNT